MTKKQLTSSQPQKRWIVYVGMTVIMAIALLGLYHLTSSPEETINNVTDSNLDSETGTLLSPDKMAQFKPIEFNKVNNQPIIKQLEQLLYADEKIEDGRFLLAKVDLNKDGKEEWLVTTEANEVCGTGGCPINVISLSGTARVIADFSPALGVMTNGETTKDWENLYFIIGDGGSAPEAVKMTYNGTRYQ